MAHTKETLVKILTKCFTVSEWAWLIENARFIKAMAELKTLDDVEQASMMGANLLLDVRQDSAQSQRRPRSPSDD
jgi:hypothetical protein